MPQDYTATNPKTGETVRWDGKAWTPVPKGGFVHGVKSLGSGLMDDVKGITSFGEAGNPDSVLGSFPEKQLSEGQDYNSRAHEAFKQGDYISFLGHAINSVLAPTMIPQMVEGISNTFDKDPMRAAGQVTGLGLMEKLPEAGEFADMAKDTTRGPIRSIIGVGKDFENRVKQDHETALVNYQTELKSIHDQNVRALNEGRQSHEATTANIEKQNAEALAKHREKVQAIKDKYASQVGDNQNASRASSASQSAADAKRSALGDSPRSGPVFQRLQGMTNQVFGMVDNLQDRIRSAYNKRWRDFDTAIGDRQVSWTPVQQAVKDAEANILKGSPESIAIFRNIMKESPQLDQASVFKGNQAVEAAQNLKEIFNSRFMDDATKKRIEAQLHSQGISMDQAMGGEAVARDVKLPFADARGYFTELGNKMTGAQLPSDVYHALEHVRDAVDEQVTGVTKEAGQDGVYKTLKTDWRDYKQAFDEPDSAIYQFDKLDTPEKRVDFLASGKGQNLIDSLSKYREFGSEPNLPGRVRSLIRQIRDLPGEKAAPAGVERPRFPGAPEEKPMPSDQPISFKKAPDAPEPLDITRKRLEALEDKAKQFSNFSPNQVRWLSSGIRQRFLGHILSNPAFRQWVATGGK